MALIGRILRGFLALGRRRRAEQDLDAELQSFLDLAVAHEMQAGISRAEALRRARLQLGSAASVKDRVRDVGWESVVESVWRDVTYGCRALLRAPVFTAVAVLTLGLGIGANTAILSVVNAVLLKPLPYVHADRLARLVMNAPASESPTGRPLRASLGQGNRI